MSKSIIKELLLNEVKDQMSDAPSLIIARYGKLPAAKSWGLRKNLMNVGGRLKVVKKGIFAKAAEKCNISFDEKSAEGNVGVVVISVDRADPLDAIKMVFNYTRENKDDNVEVLCAKIDGQMMPGPEVKYLSSLPTLDVLRAQFIALLVAPMAQTLSVMQAAIEGPLAGSEQTTQTE